MNFIKQTALSVGFDACGIAKAEALIEDAVFMKKWLVEGNHADMHYLDRNFEKRINPQVLVPGCKSVVAVLLNYFPKQKQKPESPKVAKYAYSITDYHTVLKLKLKELEQKIGIKYGDDCISTSHQHLFVDSAPVLERRWAERAGLGWIGKHTQLIHPGLGSYTFIGILMLNIDLEYDLPILPHCGTCTKCMDACPTKAIENGTLNARRCISYLTIESKNAIPVEFQSKLSDYILGCDICADVCPWNTKWAKQNSHAELSPVTNILEWDKSEWQNLTEENYNSNFSYSAIKRAGFSKLKQNIDVITKNNL
ncbi:MAG: tRNA epoxyqueuosine(34) reductase QueG [Paludibacter sp.]|nr:tRNA epoxyqueuosine(34) reductase QueG [Paludibacter sp.]